MKVVLEVDILGMGHAHANVKTGVFRVVQKIASGLADSPKCEPSWYAHEYPEESAQFILSEPHLSRYGLARTANPALMRKKRLEQGLVALEKNALERHYNSSGKGGFMSKVYRKLLFSTHRVLIPFPVEVKLAPNPSVFGRAQIFHSTWWKPPAEIYSYQHLKLFYTIYDLIPILYPKFTMYNADYPTKRAIESMTHDSWAISISQSSKNDLCNYSSLIDPNKIFVTPLAASQEIFYPCTDRALIERVLRKYSIPDKPYFLGLSTLAPHKNIVHVIKSFARLVQEQNIKELNFIMVGNKGWEFESIFEELLRNENIKARVITTGRADDEDLSALYSNALGFIFMSLYEGFGLPPLEAMQCGVPVITSNTSSLPEVVGDAGIMVDPKDEDALCQAMLRVYGNSELRAQMAEKSLQQAAKFSWDKCVQQTIQGYQTALNS